MDVSNVWWSHNTFNSSTARTHKVFQSIFLVGGWLVKRYIDVLVCSVGCCLVQKISEPLWKISETPLLCCSYTSYADGALFLRVKLRWHLECLHAQQMLRSIWHLNAWNFTYSQDWAAAGAGLFMFIYRVRQYLLLTSYLTPALGEVDASLWSQEWVRSDLSVIFCSVCWVPNLQFLALYTLFFTSLHLVKFLSYIMENMTDCHGKLLHLL